MNVISERARSLKRVVIRFAGDSGDGMQLTGSEFTRASAMAGNDISTLAEFPAEIRAPAGSLAGVSGFQVQFAAEEIFTPGDAPDVLVAMNPAALKANLRDLVKGGILIVNHGTFNAGNLKKAGYDTNPIEDGTLASYRVIPIDMSSLVGKALEGSELSVREVGRAKNFWALGLMYWLYNRDPVQQIEWIGQKFAKNPQFASANILAFRSGYAFGENTELFQETYHVAKAEAMPSGTYRSITGNTALALGLITAAQKAGLELFLGSYPITPASDILHELSRYRHFGVTTFQAEDEIAAAGSAIGAAYGGALAAVTTSGPGFALKAEALGLGLMLELPLVVIDVQRAGPSTGMPTKPEQTDLLFAMYGRSGEAPLPIIAAHGPSDCFNAVIEAARVAVKSMCPVIVLSDAFIANSSEPWLLPDPDEIAPIEVRFRSDPQGFEPYARDEATLARDWVLPGTPGLEHRIGGLEKDQRSGDISYDSKNHETMVQLRAQKVERIQADLPPTPVFGCTEGDVLVVGWGGTYGALRQAVTLACAAGKRVGHLHLRWLSPMPADVEQHLKSFKQVLVCELNTGQLWRLIRAQYLVPALKYNKVQGKPFSVAEIETAIDEALRAVL